MKIRFHYYCWFLISDQYRYALMRSRVNSWLLIEHGPLTDSSNLSTNFVRYLLQENVRAVIFWCQLNSVVPEFSKKFHTYKIKVWIVSLPNNSFSRFTLALIDKSTFNRIVNIDQIKSFDIHIIISNIHTQLEDIIPSAFHTIHSADRLVANIIRCVKWTIEHYCAMLLPRHWGSRYLLALHNRWATSEAHYGRSFPLVIRNKRLNWTYWYSYRLIS